MNKKNSSAHKTRRKNEFFKLLFLRTIGNFLILFTIFGFFATFGPALYYEFLYRVSYAQGVRFKIADTRSSLPSGPSPLGKILEEYKQDEPVKSSASGASRSVQDTMLGALLSGKKEQIIIPKKSNFSVVIPRIGANENVIANVDPSNENEFLKVLQKGVAHARGTAFPGMNGNIYLFAHSTDSFWNVGRYNAVFYLLKEMEIGDGVTIFFQGKRYDYEVNDKQIVDASEVSHIKADLGRGERLILQTCWPPGTAWKRLLVFAKPK